jgi:hypothetical protein
VNVPYQGSEVIFDETSVFWFGRLTPSENYVDVRVAYLDTDVYIRLNIFDRRVWFDTSPSASDLTAWDSVSIYLDTGGNSGGQPDANAFRFVSQLSGNFNNERPLYQAAYQGTGSAWSAASLAFTTFSGYRGEGINDDQNDRGWNMTYRIPYTSLGLSGRPPAGTVWGLGVTVHDRDDAGGTPIADKHWPEALNATAPSSWGQLHFGLPVYSPPPASQGGTATILNGVNGAVVTDAHVGGHSICGTGLDYWTEWGNANYAGYPQVVVQNQSDLADWPCFSRYYITFPLDAIPDGKVILSAQLIMHHFGNSDPSQAPTSVIQVLVHDAAWSEATITWNNGPLAQENLSRAYVDPLLSYPGWPGVARTWDVSLAVNRAYQAGGPLRLILYSADAPRHTGKYFYSSDAGEEGRPTLQVTWGNP